jgi:hypothetical protein
VSSPSIPKDAPPVLGKERKLLRNPDLYFPEEAQRAGVEGSAELLVEADSDGNVVPKAVVYSLPTGIFGRAAFNGAFRARLSKLDAEVTNQRPRCFRLQISFCLEKGQAIKYPDPHCTNK